jgi:hypothetical protein
MGLGSAPKSSFVKDLIRNEKPQVFLIQEMKISAEDVVKLGKILWSISDVMEKYSRGASRGIFTLWENYEVCLYFSFETQHWILKKIRSRQMLILRGG